MSLAPAALFSPGSYITGLSGGRQVVATAGTPVKLSVSSQSCTGVIIQALSTNTGNIGVGGSDVKEGGGIENGIELVPSQTITLYMTDANLVWLDAEVSGEGVRFLLIK